MTTNTMQLEIGFETIPNLPTPNDPPSRRRRARWWFDRMRHVVNQAFDWQPAPTARPEQIYFALAKGS